MKKIIPVKDAVGRKFSHDITEIRPGEFKGPAFKKGQTVCDDDLCRLQRLGKNNLYILDLNDDEIHENEAAEILADALAGPGVTWSGEPREGKLELKATQDGLLAVDTVSLAAFNMVQEVMCATLHGHTLVSKGQTVAATRPIPLVMKRATIERAAAIAGQNGSVVSVSPLRPSKAGLIITGNEVYEGIIEDRYAPILTGKVQALGGEVTASALAPDDAGTIANIIRSQIETGCDLILLSGGMSVDPDDVTREGIRQAGADTIHYGAAALPGAMFLVAWLGNVPLLGIPACGLYHQTTVLDLILPRILAGERVGNKALALLGHGGLCRDCESCIYPDCPFGKGS
ncbi:MAG: molybdopterin-binding protein [Deltaproteobacteria bacterium]|nr:molybdopterin-binding protein [Deltaproteobacteria bacterium]